jgi:hypothetical protein
MYQNTSMVCKIRYVVYCVQLIRIEKMRIQLIRIEKMRMRIQEKISMRIGIHALTELWRAK